MEKSKTNPKNHSSKEEKKTLEWTHKKKGVLRRGTSANTPTTESTKGFTCSLCTLENTFGTKIGLSQHMRLRHPETYHAMKAVKTIMKKKRWTEQEMRYYGKIHKRISANGNNISSHEIAKMLNEEDSRRSVESLRKIINNPRYKEILDTLPSHKPARQDPKPQQEEEKIPDDLHNSQVEPDMQHIDNIYKRWVAKRFIDASRKKKKTEQINKRIKSKKKRKETEKKGK